MQLRSTITFVMVVKGTAAGKQGTVVMFSKHIHVISMKTGTRCLFSSATAVIVFLLLSQLFKSLY